MRFMLIDEANKQLPMHRLCHIPNVSQSRSAAWKLRDTSQRQSDANCWRGFASTVACHIDCDLPARPYIYIGL